MIDHIPKFAIRLSAFITKEVFEMLRQPMLILTLILGPFLILLLFGLGFRNEPRALRTLFVVEEGSGLGELIQSYASSLGPQLIFEGISYNQEESMARLKDDEVDLVVVVPPNPYESIRDNEQAVFVLNHQEIDPLQVDYVGVFGRVYVEEVNRRVLRRITEVGQTNTASIQELLDTTRESALGLRAALGTGRGNEVREFREELDRDLDTLAAAVAFSLRLLDDIQEAVGASPQENDPEEALAMLSELREEIGVLDELESEEERYKAAGEQVKQILEDLLQLEELLEEFQNVNARILVSPFRSEIENVAPQSLQPADFYAPSVVVLLLQHLAVTFAALSIVQEQQQGTIELFQVAPVSALETILGKYLSYLLFVSIVTVILSGLVIYGLQVPMLGAWSAYGLSLGVLVFTSLGVGFNISLLAKTDSQAVQYSMIILLASVFFSGAFFSFQLLGGPVQTVSWGLPATYGIFLLQDIMLQGGQLDLNLILSLALIGVGLFGLALWQLYRHMAQQ